MSSEPLLRIAKLLLPEVLVTYFELIKHEVKSEEIHFYFTELIVFQKSLKMLNYILKASLQKLLFKISLFEVKMYIYI